MFPEIHVWNNAHYSSTCIPIQLSGFSLPRSTNLDSLKTHLPVYSNFFLAQVVRYLYQTGWSFEFFACPVQYK